MQKFGDVCMCQVKQAKGLLRAEPTQSSVFLRGPGPFCEVEEPRVPEQNLTRQILETFVQDFSRWKNGLAEPSHSTIRPKQFYL